MKCLKPKCPSLRYVVTSCCTMTFSDRKRGIRSCDCTSGRKIKSSKCEWRISGMTSLLVEQWNFLTGSDVHFSMMSLPVELWHFRTGSVVISVSPHFPSNNDIFRPEVPSDLYEVTSGQTITFFRPKVVVRSKFDVRCSVTLLPEVTFIPVKFHFPLTIDVFWPEVTFLPVWRLFLSFLLHPLLSFFHYPRSLTFSIVIWLLRATHGERKRVPRSPLIRRVKRDGTTGRIIHNFNPPERLGCTDILSDMEKFYLGLNCSVISRGTDTQAIFTVAASKLRASHIIILCRK